jgi:hypothetical protein
MSGGLEFRAVISRRDCAGSNTGFHVSLIGAFDQRQSWRVGQAETIAQINDRTQDARSFDPVSMPSRRFLGPTQCPFVTVFPKVDAVAKPVPSILTWLEVILSTDNTLDQREVTTVIDDDKRVGQYQRNWSFNLPLTVYMPVAAKRRSAVVREAAIRFPVLRSCRASAFMAGAAAHLFMATLFMQSYDATQGGPRQHVFSPQIVQRWFAWKRENNNAGVSWLRETWRKPRCWWRDGHPSGAGLFAMWDLSPPGP